MARKKFRGPMVILILLALIAGGIGFLMFKDITPQQVLVEKAVTPQQLATQ